MTDVSADQLAADVRGMLPVDPVVGLLKPCEERGLAALDALVARLEAAERERDEARRHHDQEAEAHNETIACAEAAEAALAETREWLAIADKTAGENHVRAVNLAAALEELEGLSGLGETMLSRNVRDIARRALAGGGTEQEPT